MASMLSIRNVTKRYGPVTALEDVSLDVTGGEILAIVGSNGAGKTTLIKCALGLVGFEGQVLINDLDVVKHGKEARRLVGYLPQNPALHGDLTVRETAEFYAQLRRVPIERAREVIEDVGLMEHAAKPAGALSGGMRQRLALAVALLSEPPILILDEPASSLDVQARLDLRRLLQAQRAEGKSIVLSTHWLEDIPFIADRALVLDRGKAIFLGDARQLGAGGTVTGRLYLRLNGHSDDAATLIRSNVPSVTVDRSGDWVVVNCAAEEKSDVLQSLVRAGVNILDVRIEDASVEGVIQRLRDAGDGP
jgi:ABC-2 type transport system ATP-binding protein/nitrous oxidase accessory protein